MSFNDFHNAQVALLPPHLKQYIVPQHYERYTAVDHAVWRYVMRQNYSYLKKVAYYPYIKGLERAGLSIEHIPDLQTMNDNLGEIGWGAVAVDGFIPPAIFMEFQEYKVLVIAADIRQLNHIAYTPTPDIIHESAGHAPIIADPDYNNYLSYFGAIGAKALFSASDYALYDAIRELSVLKELPNAEPGAIKKAEQRLDYCAKNLGTPSEMALLSRLHWWSVEYGLIGTLENPKIYGAGLLSSIGESVSCMKADVKKLWYNLETADFSYDITKSQPQLFVTPSFKNLIDVLEAFADTMAFRKGGLQSIQKAIGSENVATAVYSSGLQVSGVFQQVWQTNCLNEAAAADIEEASVAIYLKAKGPCALSFADKQLAGHGTQQHPAGFASPVGKLRGLEKALEDYSDIELTNQGIYPGSMAELSFEHGFRIAGEVLEIKRQAGKVILISFKDSLVEYKGNRSREDDGFSVNVPGRYDMAVGERIVSVFNGYADKANYPLTVPAYQDNVQVKVDERTAQKQVLYQKIRDIREDPDKSCHLRAIWQQLKEEFPQDWLAPLEILELLLHYKMDPALVFDIREYLQNKALQEKDLNKLILDGLGLIDGPEVGLFAHEDI